jgi:hypothetical protein
MPPIRTIFFGDDNCIADLRTDLFSLKIDRTATLKDFRKAAGKGNSDLLVLHETAKFAGNLLLDEVRKLNLSVPAILLAPAASSVWGATLDDKRIEVLCSPVNPRELEYRIAKLTRSVSRTAQPKDRIAVGPVSKLRNDGSGRLDAKLIAGAFGLSLSDLCRSIGKNLQTVHQTPDSAKLHKALFQFERVASALLKITGSPKGLKVWLNAQNDAFPGELPIDIVRQGHIELLADLLEDALLGHPD